MRLGKLLLLLIIFTISTLSAQVNSPYSRYGLGNIFPTTFGAANGMGGFSAAYFTPTNINYQNPASYSELNFATFDIGAYGNVITLKNENEQFTSGDGNLSYMAFGFPLLRQLRRHKFGMSFGLLPYSGFQYSIFEEVPTEDPQLGTIEYNYVGDGNLYQVYGGVGYKYQTKTKDTVKSIKGNMDTVTSASIFSVGGNAAQLFGSLSSITYASFPELFNSQTTKLTQTSRINGGMYNYGVGYQKQFIRKTGTKRDILTWRFGAAMSPEITVKGEQSVIWTNVQKNGNFEFITDTIYSQPDTSGNIIIPASFQGGISFSFFSTETETKNQFTLGAQYSRTMWSQYAGFQDAGNLGDSWRASLSMEFIPKIKKERNAAWALRLGGYSGMSNLIVDGVQLNDIGITAGTSIPLGFGDNVLPSFRSSRLNVFVNAGQRGSNTNISETYYNFGVGFTLVDSGWFRKFKLN